MVITVDEKSLLIKCKLANACGECVRFAVGCILNIPAVSHFAQICQKNWNESRPPINVAVQNLFVYLIIYFEGQLSTKVSLCSACAWKHFEPVAVEKSGHFVHFLVTSQ